MLLIEPAPFLCAQLKKKFDGVDSVAVMNCCVTPSDGVVDFYAPKVGANKDVPWVDLIGSVKERHALDHNPQLGPYIEKIKVSSLSFDSLLRAAEISSINLLFTDTEGLDAEILLTFPFSRLKPRQILFDHMHAGGTHHIGKKFAALILTLDDAGYNIRVKDFENCMATLRPR